MATLVWTCPIKSARAWPLVPAWPEPIRPTRAVCLYTFHPERKVQFVTLPKRCCRHHRRACCRAQSN